MLSKEQVGEILFDAKLTSEQREKRLQTLIVERETALMVGELLFAALLLSSTSANSDPMAAQQKVMQLLSQAKADPELRRSGKLLVNQLVESMLPKT